MSGQTPVWFTFKSQLHDLIGSLILELRRQEEADGKLSQCRHQQPLLTTVLHHIHMINGPFCLFSGANSAKRFVVGYKKINFSHPRHRPACWMHLRFTAFMTVHVCVRACMCVCVFTLNKTLKHDSSRIPNPWLNRGLLILSDDT